MNRQGSGTQALRSIPGNSFASQAASSRTQTMSNQRIPNGKMASGSTWGFGMPMTGGAPGLSTPPSRTGTAANFAQAIGGGSSQQAPLDLSRWASLDLDWAIGSDHTVRLVPSSTRIRSVSDNVSGLPASAREEVKPEIEPSQQRSPSTTSAVTPVLSFGSASARTSPVHQSLEHNPSSLPILDRSSANEPRKSEFPSLSGGPQVQSQNAMPQAWNSSSLRQAAPSQLPTGQRPQQSAIQQRDPSGNQQSAQAQSQSQQSDAGFGFIGSLEGQFDGQRQAPNHTQTGAADEFPPLGGGMNGGRQERQNSILQGPTFSTSVNGNSFGDGRVAGLGQAVNEQGDAQRIPAEMQGNSSSIQEGQQLPYRDGTVRQVSKAQSNTQSGQPGTDSPAPNHQQLHRRQLVEMTENEKWGLPGLLAQLPGRSEAGSSFFMGVDLNNLGIDLDSNEPLFPTFSTPFADATARPAIPDFALPAAYSVNNVPPLPSRIANFADETLFAIFYQFTRDVMQEIAAAELYTRDWRWHKELRQWMMKDQQAGAPLRISERTERGIYVFFDAMNWKRERREFILNYDHLDQRHGPTQPTST